MKTNAETILKVLVVKSMINDQNRYFPIIIFTDPAYCTKGKTHNGKKLRIDVKEFQSSYFGRIMVDFVAQAVDLHKIQYT